MLRDIANYTSKKWSTLIGRPRLILVGQKCQNIMCNKNDHFKMYNDKHYICECGYEIIGEFNLTKLKTTLFCGIEKCEFGKVKMDIDCIKCQYIRER